MEIPVLTDVVIILGLSIITILTFQKLKLPSLLGFLLAGMVAGPHALRLVSAHSQVELLSEIGVILLLFTIGLEFSIKSLKRISKAVFLGGSLQVFLTTFAIQGILMYGGLSARTAFFTAFLFSLSSTAIVLKILKSRSEVDTPYGKTILGILIFQDIVVIPVMLFAPVLAGGEDNIWGEVAMLLLKSAVIAVFVYLCSKYVVQKVLSEVAKSKSKELFIMSILVICFAVTWLTSAMGLSMSLGAFLAGLIISESEFSHQAESNILPFSEIFSAFFFVSIGMLLDISFFLEHPVIIILLTIACILIKILFASLAAISLKLSMRTILITGMSLAQVGEFAFILSKTGMELEILTNEIYQYFLSISILTMAATPFIMMYSERMAALFLRIPVHPRFRRAFPIKSHEDEIREGKKEYRDHLVIIGYGVNGRNLARAAKSAGISYLIIELNAETVVRESRNGEPIFYGDAVQDGVLLYAFTQHARVVVIGISDMVATRRIVSNVRKSNNTVSIIVKTRYVLEMDELYNLGANEVIPEEFEASIEIFTRVLNKYLVPTDEIARYEEVIRSGYYDMFRSSQARSSSLRDLSINISDLGVISCKVKNKDFITIPFQELELKKTYGVSVVAIKRRGNMIYEIDGNTWMEEDDLLYVLGDPHKLSIFSKKIG